MSLLHPTKGQILDRVAALQVKLGRFRLAGKAVAHLQAELDELKCFADQDSAEYYQLHSLHDKIWDCIVVIEQSEALDDGSVARTARLAQELNRVRYQIIQAIDERAGQHRGPEKL